MTTLLEVFDDDYIKAIEVPCPVCGGERDVSCPYCFKGKIRYDLDECEVVEVDE